MKKGKRSIFVIWGDFPPIIGGGSARGYRIYKELANRGHNITVFVGKAPNTKIYERITPNLEVIRVPPAFHHFLKIPKLPKFYNPFRKSNTSKITFTKIKKPSNAPLRKHLNISLHVLVETIKCTLLYFFSIFFYIKRKPDVIIKEATTWDLGNDVIGYFKTDFCFLKSWLILKKMKNIPLLIYFTDMWGKNDYYIKSCSKDADAIIIVDKWMGKRLRSIGIEKNIYYIPVSIKTDDYSNNNCNNLPPSNNKILFAGRLSVDRGCDVLIKAVPFIINKVDGVEVVIVGSGGRKNELEELAKGLNVEKYIKFIGGIDPGEMKKVYDDVRVFANTLRAPGIGNVTIEALASGVPVVKSRYEGFFEYTVKNGKNGYTFKVDNAEDLADKIIKVLKHENWDVLSKNARETARNFDIKKINDEFEKVILKYIN